MEYERKEFDAARITTPAALRNFTYAPGSMYVITGDSPDVPNVGFAELHIGGAENSPHAEVPASYVQIVPVWHDGRGQLRTAGDIWDVRKCEFFCNQEI